jgi:hypothetical protein
MKKNRQNNFNVICIKWGTGYGPEYVNNLYSMVKRNTSFDINFYCFTDDSKGLNKEVIVKPLPVLDTKEEFKTKYMYRKEAALCDNQLGFLTNQRVFFFDLDVVIISNLDEFFQYPKDDKFFILNDWNSKGENIGQASCYSWEVGTLGYIKEYYEKNPEEVIKKFYNASQEYLSYKVIERFGKLNFWPDNWFCSFRFHCMPKFGPLRHFITPKIPNIKGLKVIVFHGQPNPKEAIKGIWNLKDGQQWKRLYKVCKPTKWVENYWY